MRIFKVGPEPVASLEWKEERKGKMTYVNIFEYVSDDEETVVKIVTDNHYAGVGAEYAFINHKYPGYKMVMQSLTEAEINGERVACDVLTISNGKFERSVYFDISDFFRALD